MNLYVSQVSFACECGSRERTHSCGFYVRGKYRRAFYACVACAPVTEHKVKVRACGKADASFVAKLSGG